MEVMLVVLTKFRTQPCQIIPITRRQAAGKLECFLIMAIQRNLDLRKPDIRKNLDLRKIVGTTDFLVHKLFDLRKIF